LVDFFDYIAGDILYTEHSDVQIYEGSDIRKKKEGEAEEDVSSGADHGTPLRWLSNKISLTADKFE
jgi:hypothetical protein